MGSQGKAPKCPSAHPWADLDWMGDPNRGRCSVSLVPFDCVWKVEEVARQKSLEEEKKKMSCDRMQKKLKEKKDVKPKEKVKETNLSFVIGNSGKKEAQLSKSDLE